MSGTQPALNAPYILYNDPMDCGSLLDLLHSSPCAFLQNDAPLHIYSFKLLHSLTAHHTLLFCALLCVNVWLCSHCSSFFVTSHLQLKYDHAYAWLFLPRCPLNRSSLWFSICIMQQKKKSSTISLNQFVVLTPNFMQSDYWACSSTPSCPVSHCGSVLVFSAFHCLSTHSATPLTLSMHFELTHLSD